jgi:hypothetical protein
MEKKIDQIINLKTNFEMGIIGKYIPKEIIEEFKKKSSKQYRERIFGLNEVLNGMLYQALNEDKSEQNAVMYIAENYNKLREEIKTIQDSSTLKKSDNPEKKRGRPRKHLFKIQKSKLKEISLNTSSYDEARQRFPLELSRHIFKSIKPEFKEEKLWHGHKVYIVDGTSCKMVDTAGLRNYFMPRLDSNPQPLPIMRLEVLIDMYGGYLVDVETDNYNSSEGRMLRRMYPSIPEQTILLADDLYSSYGHLAFSQSKGVHIIARGKHNRKEKIVHKYSDNDIIVEWKSHQDPRWFEEGDVLPGTLLVRRISFKDPEHPDKTAYLYTTLLDAQKYSAEDILALFFCRWDIEIGMREIKIILNMEYLRGKTVNMVMKELYSYLILYNIIRIMMIESLGNNNADFFSHGKTIQRGSSVHKVESGYVDRLGRSYARKSHGRYGFVYNTIHT